MATGLFHTLKLRGRNVEYVHEVAKDLTWEERWTALGHQPYIAGKQLMKYDRLAGKVEAIITDTSTLLNMIYRKGGNEPRWSAFDKWIIEDWKARDTLDIMLRRTERPYNPAGRRQSEESARRCDEQIEKMLQGCGIGYGSMPASEDSVVLLADLVEGLL